MPSMKKWTGAFIGLLLLAGSAALAAADDVALGRQIYFQRCASCHGISGEGDGPVAPALSTPPANLRLLSDRFGNPLPEDQVARFIDGRADVKAHGPRDMPVWGARFYAETHDERTVRAMITELIAYLPVAPDRCAPCPPVNASALKMTFRAGSQHCEG